MRYRALGKDPGGAMRIPGRIADRVKCSVPKADSAMTDHDRIGVNR
ncbi:hypothetical protein BJY26_002930 [Spelaeicoccus albus]|uniref:Uncharacterized protein n=1 Tax=Spelaeicoccus albus TaxID=1280376 RepID=A0A7Z0D4A8_9MICO|nr:hypothetical protein [Spelaeicoccus albus]